METMTKEFRVERDSIGPREVPSHVYYGVQSLRGAENFHITGSKMHPQIIKSLAYIKKASAIANSQQKLLAQDKADAMAQGNWGIATTVGHNCPTPYNNCRRWHFHNQFRHNITNQGTKTCHLKERKSQHSAT